MPTLSIPRNYSDGVTLFQANLDAALNAIETFVNVTMLDTSNIQDSSITTSKIASQAVTTAKIANGAVGAAQLASDPSVDANRAVTTNHIQDASVTTPKLAANAITVIQLYTRSTGTSVGASGVAISTATGTITGAGGSSYSTIASVTITTTGRPVMIFYQPGASGGGYITLGGSATLRYARSSTQIFVFGSGSVGFIAPYVIDTPAAGTYTYTIEGNCQGGGAGVISGSNIQLVAFELL